MWACAPSPELWARSYSTARVPIIEAQTPWDGPVSGTTVPGGGDVQAKVPHPALQKEKTVVPVCSYCLELGDGEVHVKPTSLLSLGSPECCLHFLVEPSYMTFCLIQKAIIRLLKTNCNLPLLSRSLYYVYLKQLPWTRICERLQL